MSKCECSTCVLQSSTRTPHDVSQNDPYLEAMHANAEVFDHNTERLFRYLQVCLALLCVSRAWCRISIGHSYT